MSQVFRRFADKVEQELKVEEVTDLGSLDDADKGILIGGAFVGLMQSLMGEGGRDAAILDCAQELDAISGYAHGVVRETMLQVAKRLRALLPSATGEPEKASHQAPTALPRRAG